MLTWPGLCDWNQNLVFLVWAFIPVSLWKMICRSKWVGWRAMVDRMRRLWKRFFGFPLQITVQLQLPRKQFLELCVTRPAEGMPGDLTCPLFLLTPPFILSFTLSHCFWMHIPSGLSINVNDGNSCLSLIEMVTEPWKMLTAPFFLSEIEPPEYWLVLECLTRVYRGFWSVGYELKWCVQPLGLVLPPALSLLRLERGCGISEPGSTVRSVMLWEWQVTETPGTWRAL